MTRNEAHEILDAARAGVPISYEVITMALRATGDLSRQHMERRRWAKVQLSPEQPANAAPKEAA